MRGGKRPAVTAKQRVKTLTDYEQNKALREEAEGTIEFLKKIYSSLGSRDFFQQATLRSLAIIIKLLVSINSKT